uniref:Galectin n=1 Tax=Takifugu rubripes TaxID=31033 RepID=A0A674PLG0_TAKRU
MSFKEGKELKVRVKPSDCCSNFSINIGHDPDNLALHFNPRFDFGHDVNTIVMNSLSGGSWADEQHEGNFPFTRGEEAKVGGFTGPAGLLPELPDGCMINFPNRLGDVKYDYFDIRGEAKVIGIKIK